MFLKRVTDVLISLAALAGLAWLFVLAAIAAGTHARTASAATMASMMSFRIGMPLLGFERVAAFDFPAGWQAQRPLR